MEQDTVTERIKILVERYSDKPADFAKLTGLTSQNVYDLTSGRKGGPSYASIKKLLISFPEVSERWLLLGEGEMLKSGETSKNNSVSSNPASSDTKEPAPKLTASPGGKLEVIAVQVGPDGEENIEVVNTRAAAGYPQQRIQQEYISKLPSFRLPGAPYNQGSFRCFQVSGDSMEPTLWDGDWLICRAVENWGRDMRDNRVYVVVTEEDVLVKRVINQFNERGQLTLQSDNRGFGVRYLDGDLVGEVWEGVARLTRNLAGPRVDVPDELARHRADIEELFQRLNRLESGQNPIA